MPIRRALARTALKVTGWRVVGDVPRAGILVGAPHTSNWDWVATLALAWSRGVRPRVLVKKELFRGSLGWFFGATGGIPVDRKHPGRLVETLAEEARHDPGFTVVLAAEGTRSRGEYWKSGFYRLAQQTGLPVALGFIDGPSRTMGFGPPLVVTGDVRADMELVRAFYADKHGIRPANRTEPRLREEDKRPREKEPA
ncbi:MAG: acyl-phosphate glycerol 3-phosphate acyltransferase [Actinobacteria bacterium]|nr:acyl-phosphate glycerol 3-phosphate acyltransferase [Actinomycetota bacterium]